MNKNAQIITSASVGVVMMLVVLFLIQANPCPTPGQFNLYKIVMAISVGAFASIIPGSFTFRYQKLVTATGALGVFALVFFFNPVQLVGNSGDCNITLSGNVYINNKETKNVEIRINELRQSTQSDEYGFFSMQYPSNKNKKSFNFRVLYGSSLDTSFEMTQDKWEDLNLRFKADRNKIAINVVPHAENNTHINTQKRVVPKTAIQNFYEGDLPQSTIANYGGGKYCQYAMRYSGIKLQIKLASDMKSVETAKVTFKASETANAGCPLQTAAPNTHIYDLSNGTITDNSIFINFTPDHANNPFCSLSMVGTIQGSKIVASLISERIDMPDPVLVYKIKMDLQAERTNP